MRLSKTPIICLVVLLFLFSSCEPTYDEIVAEQYELLQNKLWQQISNPCNTSEGIVSFTFRLSDNNQAFLVKTRERTNANGTTDLVVEESIIDWFTDDYDTNGFFTIYFDYQSDDYFDVISVTEDELILLRNDCIYEFQS